MVKTSDMWNKIYLGVLAIAVAIMGFFNYYSWSWLQSIGSPEAAIKGYEYHSSLAWLVLWVFAVLLLLLGNSVLWASRKSWALWTTFLYFSVFLIIRNFWLDRAFLDFESRHAGLEGLSVAPIIAVSLIILAAIIVFFDNFLVTRLRAKTYPPAESVASGEPDIPAE